MNEFLQDFNYWKAHPGKFLFLFAMSVIFYIIAEIIVEQKSISKRIDEIDQKIDTYDPEKNEFKEGNIPQEMNKK